MEADQELTFIHFSDNNSLRQKGLLDSEARSHAAKISYRRRREASEQYQAAHLNSLQISNLSAHRTLITSNVAPAYDPWRLSSGYRVDPFGCIPGSQHPFARTALDFLIDYIYSVNYACNYAFGVVSFWITHALPMMAQHTALFHAILGLMTFAHQYLHKSNSSGMREQILHHQGMAIRTLRHRLLTEQNPLRDDGSILTMFMLCSLDKIMGNMEPFDIHYKQASRMVECRGGMGSLDNGSGLYAVLSQFNDLSPNSFERIVPTEALQESISLGNEFEAACQLPPDSLVGLPPGFRLLAEKGAISIKTCNAVIRMSHQLDNPSIAQRASTDEHQVVTWSHSWPDFSDESIRLLERVLCLTLVRYIVNVSSRIRGACCPYEDLALALGQMVPKIAVPEGRLERESLLWIWLVTVDVWSVGQEWGRPRYVLQVQGLELFEQMLDRFPETRRWFIRDFESLGSKYFWRKGMGQWLESALPNPGTTTTISPSTQLLSSHRYVETQQASSVSYSNDKALMPYPPSFVLPPSWLSWQAHFQHNFAFPGSYERI